MLPHANEHTISTRDLSWRLVGENLTDERMTAHEALDKGGLLNWNVRKVGLTTNGILADSNGERVADDMGIKIPNQHGIIRDTGTGPVALGIVGDRYKIQQNEDSIEFLETLVDEGGAHFEAAGYFGQGQRTFAVMKMPEGLLIGGQDAHDFYVFFTNTHDGTSKWEVWTSAVRLACTNMLKASMRGAQSRWGLRHTGDLKGKIADARTSLQLSWKWAEEFQIGADWMLDQPFVDGQFADMVNHLEPKSTSDHKGWVERQEIKRSTLVKLFAESPTNEFGRGTRWAAYNAFTEYADWYLPVKGADDDGTRRAARQLSDATVDRSKQDAWDYLVAVR